MTRTTERPGPRNYPWTTSIKGRQMTLRLMAPEDERALLEFARSLPQDDLLFLSIDMTRPEAAEQWARYNQTGRLRTILVEEGGKLVGLGKLGHSELVWTRHLGGYPLFTSPVKR